MVLRAQRESQEAPHCMLCPAGCELALSPGGPDQWQVAYPLQGGRGLCPRGSALAELLNHRGRLLAAGRRTDGQLRPLELAAACRAVGL